MCVRERERESWRESWRGRVGEGEGAEVGKMDGALERQARKTAMTEVSLMGRSTSNPLLSRDAFLEDLHSLRVETAAKADKSKSILNSLIQTITEEARANIALVSKVNKRSETLRGLFKDIEHLCEESSFSSILSNRQILSVISWITQYQTFIESLGIDVRSDRSEWDYCDLIEVKDEKEGGTPRAGARRKSILSLDAFRFANIVEAEEKMMSRPKEDDNGKLWTPALIDLFRILNQQVVIVQKSTTGAMLLETARTIIQVMIEFQGIHMVSSLCFVSVEFLPLSSSR